MQLYKNCKNYLKRASSPNRFWVEPDLAISKSSQVFFQDPKKPVPNNPTKAWLSYVHTKSPAQKSRSSFLATENGLRRLGPEKDWALCIFMGQMQKMEKLTCKVPPPPVVSSSSDTLTIVHGSCAFQ